MNPSAQPFNPSSTQHPSLSHHHKRPILLLPSSISQMQVCSTSKAALNTASTTPARFALYRIINFDLTCGEPYSLLIISRNKNWSARITWSRFLAVSCSFF